MSSPPGGPNRGAGEEESRRFADEEESRRFAGRGRRSGLLAIDSVFLAYLGATGALALAAGGPVGALLALPRLGVAAAVLWLARLPMPRRRPLLFLRLAYPVLLTPLLYTELATLNQFLVSGTLDEIVRGWEAWFFGRQLSMWASERLRSFWVSELLHAGYFSYYFLVPAALLGAFLTRGAAALHRVTVATALAFFASYVIFAVFPVAGPRYGFPPIGGEIAEGAFHDLVHAVLEGGSSEGTAFPSSHVAASGAAVLTAGREDARWLWVLLLPWLALTVGTVYGRFHYGLDAVTGLLLALAATALAPRVAAAAPGRPPRPGNPRGGQGVQ